MACDFPELKAAVTLGHSLVGTSHIDYQTLERRFGICNEIVQGIYCETEKCLKGYFILYPLSASACDAINHREIVNGRGILDEHFETGFNTASGVYIGMVGATSLSAKGLILKELLSLIQQIMEKGCVQYVYTRGAMPSGHRVISDYGFQNLGYPSEIQSLYIGRGAVLPDRLSRRLSGFAVH